MSIKWVVLTPHPPLLVPEIGGNQIEDVNTTKTAMEDIFTKLKKYNHIDTVVVITPHGPYLAEQISVWDKENLRGSLARFKGKEKLSFPSDRELVNKLAAKWEKFRMPYRLVGEGYSNNEEELDHGAYVPLYYFRASFGKDVNLVSITPGGVDYDLLWRAGELLGEVINEYDKDVGVLVSGDLSHRLKINAPAGYHPEAHEFDQKIKEILDRGDFSALKDIPEKLLMQTGECGYRPLLIAGGLLNDLNPQSQVLSYEGPFGVGYMVSLLYSHSG